MNSHGKKTTTSRFRAEMMLVAATFFWGWTFPVVREAVADAPVFAFLALRFALAACLMTVFLIRRPKIILSGDSWRFGGALGALLFAIFAFQTWGLVFTSSANSAFITGLNVVWVFLLAPGGRKFWPQTALAVVGLWLLTAPDAATFNIGDFLTLICSLFVALHILLLARMPRERSSTDLALIQFAIVAAASAVCSIALEPSIAPQQWTFDLIFAILLTAGGATVFSFWAQTHFQRYTTPQRAGLIFVCEPLFAAFFAAGLYSEIIPLASWPGAALMLIATIWAIRKGEPKESAKQT